MRADVWAPFAAHVACRTGGQDLPLVRAEDGWWRGPALANGQDYAFVVDGNGPFPDPRSPRQPHGVHGPSQAFDASAFAWSDSAWSGRDARGAVFYELHVGTFTPRGTLDAAAADLTRLAAVGIEVVELMPIAPMPGERGWGYDGVSLFAVYEQYGGPAALQRFVDAAHGLGIAVALDVVYNHFGPDGNYVAAFGPYLTSAHHTPWGDAINLDQPHSDEVRRFFADNALRWFRDFHVDVLRLDAVHALKDTSARHFLAQLSDEVTALATELGRPLSLVAESDLNEPSMVLPTDQGGLGQTAQWADDVHHAVRAYLTGDSTGYYGDFGSIETLNKAFQHVFVHDGGWSSFRGAAWGTPVPDSLDRRKFVVFASNHDQVGNRAIGDRPSTLLSPGAHATSLALVLLSPFTPLLFQGEEYGETRPFLFFSHHDEPLGTAVSEGRVAEFARHGWPPNVPIPDPQAEATFRASVIDPSGGSASIRAWVRDVMATRPLTLAPDAWERHPVSVTEKAPRQLTMTGPVRIHANLSAEPVAFEGRPLAVFGDVAIAGEGFTLQPDAVALVRA
ncbi:malto-oligosyltrehalose trehalohydrolase [Demequina sp.]|uniref:malto-oligosyltrehalose trehalohydrolase n=1 Tax=Demequina sp. TaxID=2050685 RepID=UPI003D123DFA